MSALASVNQSTDQVLPEWLLFELQSVHWMQQHRPSATVWHWKDIPEHHLYESGYILDYGEHRSRRLTQFVNSIPDCGFDFLVKETRSNNDVVYHGGQCKHYHQNVSGNDLGYFALKLMLLMHKNLNSSGYLVTSGNLCKELDLTIQSLSHLLTHYKLPFDPSKAIPLVHSQESTSRSIEQTMPRRDYQVDTLHRVQEWFQTKPLTRVVLNLTCALGKTVLAGDILARLRPTLVVAVAPLRSELENLIERLPSLLPGYQVFVFDSDYTTNLAKCKTTLQQWKQRRQSGILFTTYKSASTILINGLTSQFFTEQDPQYDSVVDEEPSSGNDSSDEKEEHQPTPLTHDLCPFLQDAILFADEVHNIPNNNQALHYFVNFFTRAIFCTATLPRNFNSYIPYDHMINEYDFKYALQKGYVVDYRIMIPALATGKESIPIECSDLANYDLLFYKALFLMNGMLSTGSRRCIVYLSSKEECIQFMEVFQKIGQQYHGIHTWVNRINDDTTPIQRKQVYQQFEQDSEKITLRILASCNCLNQAVNIIRCDSTFITSIGKKASEVIMYQRFNRASRIDSQNKAKINHCFIWCDDNYQVLEQTIRRLKQGLGDSFFDTKIGILSRNYDTQHLDEEQQVLQLNKQLLSSLIASWMTYEERWNHYLSKVKVYVDQHTKFPISTDKENGGSWIHVQKKECIKKTLSNDRLSKLRTIPLWNTWENDPWKERFEEYKLYATKQKLDFTEAQIKIIKEWIQTQKKNFKDDHLPEERSEILNTVNDWVQWAKANEAKTKQFIRPWNDSYQRFKSFCQPNVKLPTRTEIGIWINSQKTNFKNNKLTPEQLRLLNEVPQWNEWQDQNTEKKKQVRIPWDTQFKDLQAYIQTHQKLPPKRHKHTPGPWLSEQKKDFRAKTLVADRLTKLRTLPLWIEYEQEVNIKQSNQSDSE